MIPYFKSITKVVTAYHKCFALTLLYSFFFFTLILFFSCKAKTEKNAPATAPGIPLLKIPAPGLLDNAEKIRLQKACELWYDTVLKSSAFNGGILVAKNGNIIFEKYQVNTKMGIADTINAQTVFHIASVSKTFTAMAVLKLWQEGKIKLDEEFVQYFPAFNYPGVTIRSLLNHRSGLPNYLYFMEKLEWNDSIPLKNQDILQTLISRKADIKDISAANTHFSYCNTNYALLALLIEKISGVSYPQYIQQNFFIPLQMKNSFVFTAADSKRATDNYDWRGQKIANNYLDFVYGDKNIYTTPRELLIWDRALTSNVMFAAATMAEAYQPYSNERPGIKNYGLGWRMNIYPNGKKVVFHNGWWHGNNAAFVRLPEDDATIIVMGNRYTQAVYKSYQLINSFSNYFARLEDEE